MSGHVCKSCNEEILSGGVLAKGQAFHKEHFWCHQCKNVLQAGGFGFFKEKFYCPTCFVGLRPRTSTVRSPRKGPPPVKGMVSPKNAACRGCHKGIMGPYITFDGTPYHVPCIKCVECSLLLTAEKGEIFKYQGLPHCQPCARTLIDAERTGFRCYTCLQDIIKGSEGNLHLLGRAFHADCYVCCVGDHKIEEEEYWLGDSKKRQLYCKEHYLEFTKHRCGKCRKMIENQYVTIDGVDMHEACWRCGCCHRKIDTVSAREARGLYYCMNCYGKIPKDATQGVWINGHYIAADARAVKGSRRVRGYDQWELPPGCVDPKLSKRYSLEVCRQPYGRCPREIDFRRREQYLEPAVFKRLFKADVDTFLKFPLWRRMMLKKQTGLF